MLRFTLIACGISWLVAVPGVLANLGVISLGLPAQWHGLAALGPFLAAFVMRRSRDPGFRVRDLYRNERAGGVGRALTVVLVASPLLFLGISLAVAHNVEGDAAGIPSLRWLLAPEQVTTLLVVGVLYGFGEEPGWRGWLLPWLQQRHNALRSTLLVALVWAIWHAPFLVPGVRTGGAGGLVAFLIALLAAAFWLTFLFNSTGGSVLATSLWHVLWNASSLIAGPSPAASTVLGVLLATTGFGLAVIFGRRGLTLGSLPSHRDDRLP